MLLLLLHVHGQHWAGILQVLLFSTMTRVLDVLEDYLDWRGFEHLRLDGAVSSAERGDLVQQFNSPGDSNESSCPGALAQYMALKSD